MPWYWIALIVYFGINFIIGVVITIIFIHDGYLGRWLNYVIFFLVLMVIGAPLAIWGFLEAMTG